MAKVSAGIPRQKSLDEAPRPYAPDVVLKSLEEVSLFDRERGEINARNELRKAKKDKDAALYTKVVAFLRAKQPGEIEGKEEQKALQKIRKDTAEKWLRASAPVELNSFGCSFFLLTNAEGDVIVEKRYRYHGGGNNDNRLGGGDDPDKAAKEAAKREREVFELLFAGVPQMPQSILRYYDLQEVDVRGQLKGAEGGGEKEEDTFFVQWCPGGSLDKWLASHIARTTLSQTMATKHIGGQSDSLVGLFGVGETPAKHMARQVLLALSFLHHQIEKASVMHADLSLANLFVVDKGSKEMVQAGWGDHVRALKERAKLVFAKDKKLQFSPPPLLPARPRPEETALGAGGHSGIGMPQPLISWDRSAMGLGLPPTNPFGSAMASATAAATTTTTTSNSDGSSSSYSPLLDWEIDAYGAVSVKGLEEVRVCVADFNASNVKSTAARDRKSVV